MIMGIGIDLVDVTEIQSNIETYDGYLQRVFAPGEIDYSKAASDPYQRFAARFAAKEALMKALGTGWDEGVQWREIEVVNDPSGRPMLQLHGATADLARSLGTKRVWLSLSHTPSHAIAEVILES